MTKKKIGRPKKHRGKPCLIKGGWAVCRMPENHYRALRAFAARSGHRAWQIVEFAMANSYGDEWYNQLRTFAADIKGQELLFTD